LYTDTAVVAKYDEACGMDDERGPKIEKVAVRHGRLERRNGDVDYSLHPQQ